jgi:MFS family permease
MEGKGLPQGIGVRRDLPLAGAMFLTLVPVTLLVPMLHELLVVRHGASPLTAHLFMSVNMMAGVLAAPLAVRLASWAGGHTRWLMGALTVDAAAFWFMGRSESLGGLMGWRVVEGAAHLSAVTLLFAAANAVAGARRGAVMGLMGSALTLGVGLGAPLGGVVGTRNLEVLFPLGALVALLAAVLAGLGALRLHPAMPTPAARSAEPPPRRTAPPALAVPLALAFSDRFAGGIFVSSFMLYVGQGLRLPTSTRGMLMMLFMVPFALSCCPAGMLADRLGRRLPLMIGTAGFGVAFAIYGLVPALVLPWLMLLSGMLSALKLAPLLALCGDHATGFGRDGVFAAFNVAGSIGFLLGPLAGGLLAQGTLALTGSVNYGIIFAFPGALEVCLALWAWPRLQRTGGRRARAGKPVTMQWSPTPR